MKNIPGTDLPVSPLCFGTGSVSLTLPDEELYPLLDAFVDAGGNFFDTANVYGKWAPWFDNRSEQRLGKWLAGRSDRDHIVIATKGAHYDIKDPARTSRVTLTDITADIEESLRALGQETIDFYWLHRDDPTRPIGEILEDCETLRRAGKLRWYGASNFTAERLQQAHDYAKAHGIAGFTGVSNQWSLAKVPELAQNNNPDPTLVLMGDAEVDFHARTGTACIPFQATARGWFAKAAAGAPVAADLARAFDSSENRAVLAELMKESAATGHSVQTLAVVNLTKAPFPVIPITAASNAVQMKDLLDAMAMLSE